MTRAWLTVAVSCAVAMACGVTGGAVVAKPAAGTASGAAKTAEKKEGKPRQAMTLVYRAAERVRRATLEVINDVGQRKMADFTGDPRDWTPTAAQVEKDSTLWKQEMSNLGPLEPPKKSWLDADFGSLQRAVALVNNEVEALPADEQTGASWSDLSGAVAKMNASTQGLTPLCAGPTYDNLKIAAGALSIRDAAKAIVTVTRSEKK